MSMARWTSGIPIVAEMHQWGRYNISGRLQVLQLPQRHDFSELRLTPAQTRTRAGERPDIRTWWRSRRAILCISVHEELTKRAAASVDGVLLLHPVVGLTRLGDVDHYTRVRTYKALTDLYYEQDRVLLALLPLAMRMGGPREAVWHAIIRRNFGANHLIVGRRPRGPRRRLARRAVLRPLRRPGACRRTRRRTGSQTGHFHRAGVPALGRQVRRGLEAPIRTRRQRPSPARRCAKTTSTPGGRCLSGSHGQRSPRYLLTRTRPGTARESASGSPDSAAPGKSTTADVLTSLLMEHGRQVTVLDGDVVRTNLSKGLGFSKEDRDTNILRIGYVASEIVRHGGVAICAAISPYIATRDAVRKHDGRGPVRRGVRGHASGRLRVQGLQGNVRKGTRR